MLSCAAVRRRHPLFNILGGLLGAPALGFIIGAYLRSKVAFWVATLVTFAAVVYWTVRPPPATSPDPDEDP